MAAASESAEQGKRMEQRGPFGSSNPAFGVDSLGQDVEQRPPATVYPTLSLYVMILGGVALFRSVL